MEPRTLDKPEFSGIPGLISFNFRFIFFYTLAVDSKCEYTGVSAFIVSIKSPLGYAVNTKNHPQGDRVLELINLNRNNQQA